MKWYSYSYSKCIDRVRVPLVLSTSTSTNKIKKNRVRYGGVYWNFELRNIKTSACGSGEGKIAANSCRNLPPIRKSDKTTLALHVLLHTGCICVSFSSRELLSQRKNR